MRLRIPLLRLVLPIVALGTALQAQQSEPQPRTLTGSVSVGYLNTQAREFFSEDQSNGFTTVRLNYLGYLLDPNFISYTFRGRGTIGDDDGITGLSEGSGFSIDTSYFSNRAWPFRLYYSRSHRPGRFTGLSDSYTRFASMTDDSNWGGSWNLHFKNLPSIDLAYGHVDSSTLPEQVLISGFASRSENYSARVRDTIAGWNLQGEASKQKVSSDYVLGSSQSQVFLRSNTGLDTETVQADRRFGEAFSTGITALRTSSEGGVDGSDFNQLFQSFSPRVDYRQGKLQASSQFRLTKSELNANTTAVLSTTPQTSFADVVNRQLDSQVRYQLFSPLAIFAKGEYTNIKNDDSRFGESPGSSWNTGAGLQFATDHGPVRLGAVYFVNANLNRLRSEQDSQTLGHSLDLSASTGDLHRWAQLTAVFSLTRSHEDLSDIFGGDSRSERGYLSVSRGLPWNLVLELRGGLNRTRYERQDLRSNFNGYEYGANLRNARLQLGITRTAGSGDSLQGFLKEARLPVTELVSPSPLFTIVGSSNSNTTVSAFLDLGHSLSLRGAWRYQAQDIAGKLAARYEQQEAALNYNFRKTKVEAGYVVYRFNFGSEAFRRYIIFRITREFRAF